MSKVFFLSNYDDGPLKGQGHGQGPKLGNPGHAWHWIQKNDRVGKAHPWWLARHSTSKSRRKLSDMPETMALKFTTITPNSRLHLPQSLNGPLSALATPDRYQLLRLLPNCFAPSAIASLAHAIACSKRSFPQNSSPDRVVKLGAP
jgi:hypothetical protein